jgi:hypothetical protein
MPDRVSPGWTVYSSNVVSTGLVSVGVVTSSEGKVEVGGMVGEGKGVRVSTALVPAGMVGTAGASAISTRQAVTRARKRPRTIRLTVDAAYLFMDL